jgi:hypothetical protein
MAKDSCDPTGSRPPPAYNLSDDATVCLTSTTKLRTPTRNVVRPERKNRRFTVATFEVTPEWASAAIMECAQAVITAVKPSDQKWTFEHGNGNWDGHNYFNCGCNQFAHTAPPNGAVGTLSLFHLKGLEQWFISDKIFSEYKPNVLKGAKWNFTFVCDGRAFNFHMQVA